jgi:hypothetical protein
MKLGIAIWLEFLLQRLEGVALNIESFSGTYRLDRIYLVSRSLDNNKKNTHQRQRNYI